MDRLTIEYCGEYVPKELCGIDRLGGADDCDLCCEYCKATEEGTEGCKGCMTLIGGLEHLPQEACVQ